jgi:hypothetical protein
MNPQARAFKVIRRVDASQYVTDQTVEITIGAGGGTDTDIVENVPVAPNSALEIELDDGSTFVILGYSRK